MIVVCPTCRNKYSVHPEAIGDGKLVRCAMCGAMWQQAAIDENSERKKYVIQLMKWIFFWFAVFVCLFSLFFAKSFMVKIWRPVSVFYDAFGISPTDQKKTFLIQNVVNFFVQKNDKLYMGIRGEVVNISSDVQTLPGFTISLTSDRANDGNSDSKNNMRSLYKKSWTHDMIYKKLLPNQKVVFETELQSVPLENLVCNITLDAP